MKTIVAVAFQNKKNISEHLIKCRNFLIYTIKNGLIESKKLLELSKEETIHALFNNKKNNFNDGIFDCDILLTRCVENGLINKLAIYNVICYRIDETDPDVAVEKLINGTLEAFAPVSNDISGCKCNCGDGHHHHYN